MHLRIRASISLMVLTIVDLCLSLPNFVEHTTNHLSDEMSKLNSNHSEFHSSNKHFAIKQTDDSIDSDKSENNELDRNGDRIAVPAETIAHYRIDSIDHSNFLITNYLADGEIERRIHFNGITAKETLVSKSR